MILQVESGRVKRCWKPHGAGQVGQEVFKCPGPGQVRVTQPDPTLPDPTRPDTTREK